MTIKEKIANHQRETKTWGALKKRKEKQETKPEALKQLKNRKILKKLQNSESINNHSIAVYFFSVFLKHFNKVFLTELFHWCYLKLFDLLMQLF